ncbi:transcription factor AP-2 [Cooperia oncophora]
MFENNKRALTMRPETKPTTSNVNPLEVFDEAPGRLCLLNASTKYKVALSEIHRRMSHPETLHASLINGILRKAKTKGRCKCYVADWQKEVYPYLRGTKERLAATKRRFLAGIMGSHIRDEVPEDPEDYVEKNSATHSINIFSMLTHGFGHNALKSAWRVLGKIVDQQHAMLQGVPHQPPNFMPYHMQQFL